MQIDVGDPFDPQVLAMLNEHLADMYATSPLESVHALDPAALAVASVTLYVVREGDAVVGMGALKELAPDAGEIKSMRTAEAARGRGIGAATLEHLIAIARERGYTSVHLETGSQDFFAPARRLYARHGFMEGEPFADYVLDPNSVFMHLPIVE